MSQVKLILRDGVPGLGEAGDLVQVKPGFARNYLIPQGKAIFANDARIKEVEHQKRVVAEKAAKEMKDLKAVKAKVESLKLEVKARVGDEGKLFGSVTSSNIHELLSAEGIEVDRRRIEQVLTNILSNATKFTPKQGQIDIRIGETSENVQVCIADNGPGIPSGERTHIFDKFYVVTDGRGLSGLGLGLYISKQLIDLHGGRIWVDSQMTNGSTFCFEIPKEPAQEMPQ